MFFRDIVGQKEIKERLIQSVLENRIPHAQLIFGPEGVGKLQVAVAFARFVACTNRQPSDACGECPSCLKFNKLQHPDLHFVFPVVKPANKTTVVCDDFVAQFRSILLERGYFNENDWYSYINAETKSGLIYANESNEMIRKLSFKSFESEYKMMVIWLPERMHVSCGNKLLKWLEEPQGQTLFLLVSNSYDDVLGTILSRTQQIPAKVLTQEEIKTQLSKTTEYNPEQIQNLAHIANGSYLRALHLIESNEELTHNFERFTKWMRWIWQVGNKRDYAALIEIRKWSEELASSSVGREKQKAFLRYAQGMVRENFLYNLKHSELNYLTLNEAQFSENFAPFINEQNVEEMMEELSTAERQLEQNVNAKMIFFDISLKMIMLLKR